jgi:hypothetical protein
MNDIARVCVRHFAPSLRPPAVGLAFLRRPYGHLRWGWRFLHRPYGTPILQRRSSSPR